MQDLYGSHTVCVSARPARENEGFELRAMCMDTAGSPAQPYKLNQVLKLSLDFDPNITESCPTNVSLESKTKLRAKKGQTSGKIGLAYIAFPVGVDSPVESPL